MNPVGELLPVDACLATNKIDTAAVELVKEVDGLPLALSTTRAYLEHVTTSFSEYLQLSKASWLKLQQMSPQLRSYEDRSLYTTWLVTLDRVEQQNPASAKLLKLWAYFDRQDVWFELLRHAHFAGYELIRTFTEDELQFNEAVRLLCNYGLVDADWSFRAPDEHGRAKLIHRLLDTTIGGPAIIQPTLACINLRFS